MDKNKVLTSLLAVLTVIAVGMVLKATKIVVLPLIIAWLLSHLLSPALDYLCARKVNRTLGSAILIVALLGLTYLCGNFVIGQLRPLTSRIDFYQERLVQINHEFSENMDKRFPFLKHEEGLEPEETDPLLPPSNEPTQTSTNLASTVVVPALAPIPDTPPNFLEEVDWGSMIKSGLVSASGGVVAFARNLVLITVVLFFLLLGKPYVRYKVMMIFNQHEAAEVREMEKSIGSDISRYLVVQFLISGVTGILVWGTLDLLNVHFAATWGMLAFFLNFIPTLGSIIATIPPILVAMVQYYPDLTKPILVLIALLAIQQIMGNILTPKVMGDRLDLSPVTILVSLLFFGWLWGGVGALLATPLAVIIKLVCAKVELMKPLGIMMSSGKALKKRLEDGSVTPQS